MTAAVALLVSSAGAMADDPVRLSDVHSATAGSSPANLTAVGSTLFFTADNGSSGRELWKSDGTPAGTVQVADINLGPAGSNPGGLTNLAGTLYFSANDGTTGAELWSYDPSGKDGPQPVADIRSGSLGSNPAGLTVDDLNGTLYFSANDGTTGAELWSYDPSGVDGPQPVADIRSGSLGSNPAGLTVDDSPAHIKAPSTSPPTTAPPAPSCGAMTQVEWTVRSRSPTSAPALSAPTPPASPSTTSTAPSTSPPTTAPPAPSCGAMTQMEWTVRSRSPTSTSAPPAPTPGASPTRRHPLLLRQRRHHRRRAVEL